jgi:hypothetical protein
MWRVYTLAGWLPGAWTQSGVFVRWNGAIVSRYICEAYVLEVGGGACGPCPVFALYPSIHLTTEEKSRKDLSRGSQKNP